MRTRALLTAAAVLAGLIAIPVPAQAGPATFFIQRQAGTAVITQAGVPTANKVATVSTKKRAVAAPKVVSKVTR